MVRKPHYLDGKTKDELHKIRTKNIVNDHGGFKVNDPVKLNIAGIDPDHTGKIKYIRYDKVTNDNVFFVTIKSKLSSKAGETWGPVYLYELEKVK
jgi:hypothetical protein